MPNELDNLTRIMSDKKVKFGKGWSMENGINRWGEGIRKEGSAAISDHFDYGKSGTI